MGYLFYFFPWIVLSGHYGVRDLRVFGQVLFVNGIRVLWYPSVFLGLVPFLFNFYGSVYLPRVDSRTQ